MIVAVMATGSGEIMGYFAYAHPFLDANGRTTMLLRAVLAHRAGFSINWAATGKADYLSALTKELDNHGKGYLDVYLRPFIRPALPDDQWQPKLRRRLVLMGLMNRRSRWQDEQPSFEGALRTTGIKAESEIASLRKI